MVKKSIDWLGVGALVLAMMVWASSFVITSSNITSAATAVMRGIMEVITRRVIFGAVLAVAGAIWLSLTASSSESAINPLLGNTFLASRTFNETSAFFLIAGMS